jgi:hypothetical protein
MLKIFLNVTNLPFLNLSLHFIHLQWFICHQLQNLFFMEKLEILISSLRMCQYVFFIFIYLCIPVFCRYVTYNAWLPRHALSAVRILLAITTYPASHSQLISAFTSSQVHRMEIRHGFVECLEADDEIDSVSCMIC